MSVAVNCNTNNYGLSHQVKDFFLGIPFPHFLKCMCWKPNFLKIAKLDSMALFFKHRAITLRLFFASEWIKEMFKFLLITGSEMQFSDCYQKDTILLKRAEKFIKQNNLLEISWDASTLNDSQICILH